MLRRAWALLLSCLCALLTSATPAHAWIENHVLADDIRVEVDRHGKATVEHHLRLKTNGNQRFREYVLRGVDADAKPLDNSYAIPARDALSGSLQEAVPLTLSVKPSAAGAGEQTAALKIKVSEGSGLRRGTYVLVLRYTTDLRGSERIRRDGGRVRVDWRGPLFDDGFDNGRVTFMVPAAPTSPRAVERHDAPSGEDEVTLAPTYLFEVRRGDQQDEVEIMRPFIPKDERVPWAVRIDLRALAKPPTSAAAERVEVPVQRERSRPNLHRLWPWGAGLLLFYALLTWLKVLEVRRRAQDARALVPTLVPAPLWLRVPLAGLLLSGGLTLQLVLDHATWGAVCIVAAAALAAHGAASRKPKAWMRGPGRWLTVSEQEALARPARRSGAWLDAGSWRGRLLLLLLSGGVAAGVWLLSHRSLGHALMVGFDGVALLAIFGTGRASGLPPDPVVAPAALFRKLIKRLRKDKAVGPLLRLAPRLRIPQGEVDADELRLRVVPRLPLRGFGAIEVGLTYALGWEATVAMPEVLVRVVEDSPCDRALASVSRRARITPGRKPGERVIALSPRLPTVRMTAELVAALAMRVIDRAAIEQAAEAPAKRKPAKAKPAKSSADKRRGKRAA